MSAESHSPGGRVISLPVRSGPTPVRPSRSGKRRAIALAVVQILMIAHFVHWRLAGTTLTPVEPSEAMELVKQGVINAGAIFFVLALIATMVFGRFFCGWGCHIIMLQDLCGWLLRRVGLRPKPFRSRILVYVPLALAIYMFVWPAVFRWGVAPLTRTLHGWLSAIPDLSAVPPWPGFSTHIMTDDFWHAMPGVAVAVPFFFVCGFVTVYFLGNKGYCTYACPYGGFFAPFEQFAPGRIRVTDACEHCGHCTSVCTSNVRVHEEVRDFGMVVDPGCMKCLDCVSVCPKDALYFGFGKPASIKQARQEPKKRRPDLTIAEEIGVLAVFIFTFVGVRGIYGLVPMLMASGVAICVTFLVWKAWRVVRDDNASLHRFRLKYRRRTTKAGAAFLAIVAVVGLLTVHSFAVSSLTRIADWTDGKVTIPRSMVFTTMPSRMPDDMAEHARRAIRYYDMLESISSGGIAFVRGPQIDIRRAWLNACLLDYAEAERLMRDAIERGGAIDHNTRDLVLLMRIQSRDEEATAYAREIIAAHPNFIATLDGLVTWLESEGQATEALALAEEALKENAGNDAAELFLLRRLSLLQLAHGDPREGIRLIERTIEIDATNPASYLVLAEAYARQGMLEQAAATLYRALDAGLETRAVLEETANVLSALGREDEAATFRERAAAIPVPE